MLTKYLLLHHKNDLVKILEHEDTVKQFSVNINFLELFEDNPSVGNKILKEPDDILEEFAQSIEKVQSILISGLCKQNLTKKTNVHIRIYSLPSCPELNRVIFPKSQDLGLFLQVSGTVVRTTITKMLEHQRQYMCAKCKYKVLVKADFEQKYIISPPKRCSNPEECKGTNLITLSNLDSYNCKDYQEIKIQEQVSKLGVGSMPNSMWVTLEDDLVELCKPGDNITICGTVKRRWKSPTLGKKLGIELVIKANHIQLNNYIGSIAIITPEIKQQFFSFWEKYKTQPLRGRDLILKSFCPQIYGLYIVKLAVMVVLAGGSQLQKENDTGVKTRSEAHLLLVGDPGTGKSQLLKFASKIVPRSVLTTGVGSTSAGLTVAAVMENGEWQLEAGALVLADGGLCCIDEFNSMKEHDRTSIHEAMEQQTISVAKASIVCKLNTRCSVLAATNPKGHLDESQPLTINIALASPLLSRFDLVLILKDTIDDEWDNLVADYILGGHKTTTNSKDHAPWPVDMLQAYFCVIKKMHPILTDDSIKILSSYYQLQRRSTYRNKARTTVRLLDSLVRLSQAHARLMFHAHVEVMDAITAVILAEASMQGDAAVLSLEFNMHSAYPENPMATYSQLSRVVLGKLELFDILEKETSFIKNNYVMSNAIKIETESSKEELKIPEIILNYTEVVHSRDNYHNSYERNLGNRGCERNVNELSNTDSPFKDATENSGNTKTEMSSIEERHTKRPRNFDIFNDRNIINLIPSVNDSFTIDYEENIDFSKSQRIITSQSSTDLSLSGKERNFMNQFCFKPKDKSVFNHSQSQMSRWNLSTETKLSNQKSVFDNHDDDLDLDI